MNPLLLMALPFALLILFAIGLYLAFAWTAPTKSTMPKAGDIAEVQRRPTRAHPKVSDT